MASSHKDLIAWQLSRDLAVAVQRWSENTRTRERAHIHDQIRRAALSVPLNIAEGYTKGPSKGCRNYFRIALGSAVETGELLDMLKVLGEPVDEMIELSTRVRGVLYMLWKRSKG